MDPHPKTIFFFFLLFCSQYPTSIIISSLSKLNVFPKKKILKLPNNQDKLGALGPMEIINI